nr:unnamed protein product [Callosobruchus chinensis]
MMEEAWVNEKFAPEILPHKMEVVDCLLGQIAYMEENLQSLACTDFRKSVHQLEVDRLRFLGTFFINFSYTYRAGSRVPSAMCSSEEPHTGCL